MQIGPFKIQDTLLWVTR